MELDLLKPHSGSHSVQSVVMALEWASPIETTVLEAANDQLKSSYDLSSFRCEPQHAMSFNIGGPAGTVTTTASPITEVVGYNYSHLADSGEILQQIQLSKSNLLFIVSHYTRWDDLIATAESILNSVASIVIKSTNIGIIGLQYLDRFVWAGDRRGINYKSIFNHNSKFLTPHIFECEDDWHSHHGYFEKYGEGNNRILNVINTATIGQPSEIYIDILSSHRMHASPAISNSGEKTFDDIKSVFTDLHIKNKAVLREMLTVEVLNKIGMHSNQQ